MVKAAEQKREIFDFFKNNAEKIGENTELIHSAKELLGLFGKVIRGYKLYPRSNPAFTRFADQFKDKLDTILNKIPSISFKITTKGVMVANTLLESTEKDREIVFFLYNDGLRELFFQKGTTKEEIASLFNVLAQCTLFANEDYDLPTLLWDGNFDNIGYITEDELVSHLVIDNNNSGFAPFLVEELSFGEGLGGTGGIEDDDGEGSGGQSSSESSTGTKYTDEDFEQYSQLIFREKEEIDLGQFKEMLDRRIFNHSVGKMEMLKFNEALKKNSDPFIVNRFLRELSTRLLTGQGTEAGDELLETASMLWEKLLLFGSVKGAVLFIKTIMAISEKLKDIQPEYCEKINAGLKSLSEEEFINDIFATLEDIPIEEVNSIGELFAMIPPNMLEHLVSAINSINTTETRIAVINSFSKHIKISDELIQLTKNEDWKIVRNALALMKDKQDPRIVPAIRDTMNHPQKQARIEALSVLMDFSIEEALPALEKAVFSISREVRNVAIRKILELREPRVKAIVNRSMQPANLKKLETDEIDIYFKMIIDFRRDDLYDLLANLLFNEDPLIRNKAIDALLHAPTLTPFSKHIAKASDITIISKYKKEDLRHLCKLFKPEIYPMLIPALENVFHIKGALFDKSIPKAKEIIFRALASFIEEKEVVNYFRKGLSSGNKETSSLIDKIAGKYL
jgi:hypothetical protein